MWILFRPSCLISRTSGAEPESEHHGDACAIALNGRIQVQVVEIDHDRTGKREGGNDLVLHGHAKRDVVTRIVFVNATWSGAAIEVGMH